MSIQIWYKPKTVGRDEYLDFYTERIPGGRYGEGGFQTAHISRSGARTEYYDSESAKKTAAQKAANYLGVPIWEISGYEYLKPPDIAPDAGLQAITQREADQQARIDTLHARREALRQGYSGKFSDTALKDVTTDLGEYLPSYIQNLPQEKAEAMIKEGKIGGWQVDNRYFRTKQEADAFINRGTTIPSAASMVQGKPWMPEAYGQLQVTKDLKKRFESTYEPYVTIEGTTLYRPRNQPTSVTVPRFGKMVPGYSQGAALSVFGVDIISSDSFTRNTNKFISENFEKGERFVADKLMLHEILNPAIRTLETRERSLTLQERRSGKQYDTMKTLASSEFAIGALTGLRDKPLTVAGNVALMILTRGTLNIATKAVPIIAKGVGTGIVTSKVSAVNILGAGLAGMYGYDVHRHITTSSSPARTTGEIVATELIPFGVGGYLGTKPLRIKSNINEAIRILKSQKGPLKAFYYDESGMLRKTKWQLEAGKPTKKEVAQPQQEPKQGTDVFNYFKGRTPAQPLSGVGKGGLGEFKSPGERLLEQITPAGSGRESYLEYQKRVVSGVLKPESQPKYVAYKKRIPKTKDILKSTTAKKGNIATLEKLWEDRGIKAVSKETGTTTKEGQIVLTKQKIIQITKQDVKTTQLVKEKAKTIQLTKEAVKIVDKPKTGVYTIAYVSAATRLLNRLKENTQTANAVILREQARTKPQTFTSETAKAINRIKEKTKAIVSERSRLAEKEQVRERVREKVRERTKEKQRIKTIEKTKMRVPEKLVKLGLPKFSQEISRIAKKRKNRGKYIWDVNNPVPTLEQVLG